MGDNKLPSTLRPKTLDIGERLSGSKELVNKVVSGAGLKESKLLAAVTTIASLGLLGYGIYFTITNNKSLTGIIISSIIIFLVGTIAGYHVVKQSRAGFMRFLGGVILQICLPTLIIFRFSQQSPEFLKNWWIFYGICLVILTMALVIAFSERFATVPYTLAFLTGIAAIFYVTGNYIGKGFWNTAGVILWTIFVLIFVLFLFIGGYLETGLGSAWAEAFGFITILALPALGITDTFYNPDSFWSGWWYVFLISIFIAGIMASISTD